MKKLIDKLLFVTLLSSAAHIGYAETATVNDTKIKIKQLEKNMASLGQTLNDFHHKRDRITQELAQTEKEISKTMQQLTIIQQNITEKQQQITVLKQLIDTLNHQMAIQRELLAKHLRSRYKSGEYQPIKWLLNQENPYAISRLFTYYQYVVKARQETINKVIETQTRLTQNKEKLLQETQKQAVLENQVKDHQKQLSQNKRVQAALMQSLDNDIQSKQQTMEEFQHNKQNLSLLIKQLAQQGLTTRRFPLMQTRRQLQKPVDTSSDKIEKINQGIVFYAPEGTPVHAVSPGKIVFCDWLKGYGLLMIVDHGGGYMTLYAHNQALLKNNGEFVDKGEKIAVVGRSGGINKTGLYFEVRHGGKAIPPLQWLS